MQWLDINTHYIPENIEVICRILIGRYKDTVSYLPANRHPDLGVIFDSSIMLNPEHYKLTITHFLIPDSIE